LFRAGQGRLPGGAGASVGRIRRPVGTPIHRCAA